MQGKELTSYFLTIGVMIVVVIGVGIAIYILRGRLFSDRRNADIEGGGVLEAMRAMRDRGEIPDDEYKAIRAAIVAKAMSRKADSEQRPAESQTPPALPGERRARPGYDLTGAPLPPRTTGREPS